MHAESISLHEAQGNSNYLMSSHSEENNSAWWMQFMNEIMILSLHKMHPTMCKSLIRSEAVQEGECENFSRNERMALKVNSTMIWLHSNPLWRQIMAFTWNWKLQPNSFCNWDDERCYVFPLGYAPGGQLLICRCSWEGSEWACWWSKLGACECRGCSKGYWNNTFSLDDEEE